MITRVRLKNWRSHLDSDFKFTKGTNALIGIVGSGKTSVMNAICFGLFGTFPDLQSRKLKLDDVIMNRPSVMDESQVIVDFAIDGKKYSVLRVIERNKGTTYSEIREEGNLLDAPNAQRVTELVEKILKIDYDLFTRAIYSEQNELDYFLRLPRGERMKRIDNLLMIDRFEQARSSVVTLINRLLERKMSSQKFIEHLDPKKLRKSLEDVEHTLKKLGDAKSKLSLELGEKEKEKRELEQEIKALENLERELTSLREEKKSIEGAIEENEEGIKAVQKLLEGKKRETLISELQKMEAKMVMLREQLEKVRKEHEVLTQNVSEKEARMNFLKDEAQRLSTEVYEKLRCKEKLASIQKEFGKNPSNVLEQERKELERVKEVITSLQTRLSETSETLKKVLKLRERCPVCDSRITEEKRKKLIEKYRKKMEKMEEEIKAMVNESKLREEKILELERVVKEFERYKEGIQGLDELQEKLKKVKETYSELMQKVEKERKDLQTLKSTISFVEKQIEEERAKEQKLRLVVARLDELDEKNKRLSSLKSRKKSIEDEIRKVSERMGGKNLEVMRKSYRELISTCSQLASRVKSLEEMINMKKTEKERYENDLASVERERKTIIGLEKIIEDLKIFERALERTQTQLRERFVDTVNYTMNEIWSSLYPYGDFMSARLAILERDYVLQLQRRNGDWVNVEGMVSGGERAIACLALRIAFSLALAPQLKILILDEPTANLDRASISVLASTLRERIGDFMDQIFLITHQPELEEAVTGSMYHLERDKASDEPTRVRTT